MFTLVLGYDDVSHSDLVNRPHLHSCVSLAVLTRCFNQSSKSHWQESPSSETNDGKLANTLVYKGNEQKVTLRFIAVG